MPVGQLAALVTAGWPRVPVTAGPVGLTSRPVVVGGTVDPFAGAGTTLLAAVAEGACGIGIEIDPDYVATARARLAAAAAEDGSGRRVRGA